jgi:peroxiredoxin
VYAQGPKRIAALARDRDYPFSLAVDPERATARAYGVYVRLNFESWNMARPSTFLIDPAGAIAFIHVGAHQRDWPPSASIWAVLDAAGRAALE